ncbi:amidohydrolase family protein [Gordonia humi]|uniref:Cytosine/adenosine deaminase-related metal-dependent hydrolase n=1 Tax=Gordonia humi TaxID=686429 RepID=A0A840FD25_9ACTN|nr:amidohydrolase family protein [Gordonia humi]MBB4138020.1 cytosine/adenosine deaminase-related metal-dependent hydrolase [Gordonia humi]
MTNPPSGPLLLRGGFVITQDSGVEDGFFDVLVKNGRIEAVGTELGDTDAHVIDASGMAILPGFVDTHRHLWSSLFRFIATDWGYNDYYEIVQVEYSPRLTPADLYTANLLGALSAIDAGVTTLRDESHVQNSPEHTDQLIEGLRDSGVRAVFAYGWPSVDLRSWQWDEDNVQPHPRDMKRVREEVLNDDSALVTLNAMLRGPELVGGPDTAAKDIEFARELDIHSSMHVGHLNQPGIEWLDERGVLGPDLLFLHCTKTTDNEFRLIRDSGGHVQATPYIESVMGGVRPPALARMLNAGLKPGLGIDTETAAASDMFHVMRAALTGDGLLHTVGYEGYEDVPRVTASDVLEAATISGAAAAGLDDRTGSITPGKAADLVLLRMDDINLYPVVDPVKAIVAGGHQGNVDTVMVAGNILKWRGELLHPGLRKVQRDAKAILDRIVEEVPPVPAGYVAGVDKWDK